MGNMIFDFGMNLVILCLAIGMLVAPTYLALTITPLFWFAVIPGIGLGIAGLGLIIQDWL